MRRALTDDRSTQAARTTHVRASLIGAIVWPIAITVAQPPLASAILLLNPLILVPLALRLVEMPATGTFSSALIHRAVRMQLPAALILSFAFALPQGRLAAAFCLPWLVVTSLLAIAGGVRIRQDGPRTVNRMGESAALVFLAVGGIWTLLARGGIRPLGLSDTIVLLTGVHFHYAGFVLPLLAHLACKEASSMLGRLTVVGIVIGVPLVGVGIAISPAVEVAASLVLTAACLLLAIFQCRLAARSTSPLPATLLAVSGMSLTAGMSLAAVYAIGQYTGTAPLDIPTMIPLHGLANAIGFALCGLLAWNLPQSGP